MYDNDSIINAIKDYFSQFHLSIAHAIRERDWLTLCRKILPAALAVLIAVILAGKFLGTLLRNVFALPLVLLVLGLSYKMNCEDRRTLQRHKNESIALDQQAESTYEYVRDALFLALRSVAEYTSIIMPARASAIEVVQNPYSLEDGYVTFNFAARTCGPIDTSQFGRDIQKTIQQMHRAQELRGFPRDLVEVNGGWYCPLQILGEPQDFGDYIQFSVVFATEKTVKLTRAHRLFNLENYRNARGSRSANLTDDEL